MNCKYCNSEQIRKDGTDNGVQRYMCNTCNRTFSVNPPTLNEEIKKNKR